ncbi:MAG TPA: hypothetical protein PLW97_08330 [Synergistaceae bacterium]|nr:hypothetical protein [Synergistaceae bacterium]HPQ37634.1 hypothetical protein [Synergistaceae bacterium]
MKIIVNDMEWLPSKTSLDDLGRVWEELNDVLSSRGEVMYSIEVDGEEMLPEALLQLSGDHDFIIRTKPIRTLVRESLEEAQRYLPALLKGYETIADKLEKEKTKEALELMQQAFEGTQWILGVTQNCQVLLGESFLPDTEEGKSIRDQVALILGKMENALEGQRFFEIAFLIREELLLELEKFDDNTQKLCTLATSEIQ